MGQQKHTVDTEFSVTNFFCLHFSEHAQWGLPVMSDILVKIFVDISYFDAQVRCTYLVPNMTLTLMFNRNYNNLRYSIKKIKSLLEQKFFLLKSVCEFSLKHWQ